MHSHDVTFMTTLEMEIPILIMVVNQELPVIVSDLFISGFRNLILVN